MADQRLVKFEGKTQAFPADATDAEISAALNAIPAANAASVPKAKTWTDRAVDLLPAAGAALGGIVGGIGGTVAGMGVGGVPGAAGGAGIGGAAGEAAKQLINRARGAEVPANSGDAANAIAKEGMIDAASTGAMGALGARIMPAATTAIMDYVTNPAVPKTGAAIGKAVGAIAPALAGAYESGPLGAIAGLIAASKGAWAGGKTGWFTAKLTQDAARPIAAMLSKATGIGIAALAESLSGLTLAHGVDALIGAGIPTGEAVRTVANAHVKAQP